MPDGLDIDKLFGPPAPAPAKPAAKGPISNTTDTLNVNALFGAAPTVPPGLPKITVRPQHDSYLGRVTDVPTDIVDVFMQGLHEVGGAPAKLQEDVTGRVPVSGEQLKDVPSEAQPMAKELFGAKTGSEGVTSLLSGFFDIVGSPIKGPARSMITAPIAEKLDTTPQEVEKFTDFVLPGIGVVPYLKGAKALAGLRQSAPIKGFEKLFSPTTVDANAEVAETLLRGSGGMAARATESTRAELEPFHRTINALPGTDRLGFIDFVEGNTARTPTLTPELTALGQSMKDAFELRKTRLQAMPGTAQAQFIDDYFPHFWKDPNAARQFAQNFGAGGAGKQGSGASLKARTMPTVADGIRAGLEPLTTDPIEATMRYVASMDRFIAAQQTLDTAKSIGQVKYIKPKVMGASGNPDSFKVPPGWVAIEGRGAQRADGARAYAPEGFARVYNNFISRGIHDIGAGEYGDAYNAVQRASNAITALELGLSGFHAVTMANEAGISKLATGIHDVVGGAKALDAMRILRGVGKAASAPAAPITSYLRGRGLEKVYLGQTPGTPDMAKITDLLEKAGGRGRGAGHARDYQFSAMGSYWKAFKQGALKAQMQASMADIKAHPVIGPLRQGFAQMGRVLSTVSQPLFEVAIPRLKNGAFYDTMKAWLDANPAAPYDQQVKAAREIWDSIDNRFGELVNDNVFWNQLLKQSAQLAMRSYSWNLGTVREVGGGAKDIASGSWSPRAAYVIALPIWVGTMNAVYQKLKTGKNPESVTDLIGGQTGGITPEGTPERVSIPGYQKDVMGWYEDWWQEAMNKRSTLLRVAGELPGNKNWRGDPIFNPEASAPEWLKQFFQYAGENLGPFAIKQMIQGGKEGSNITRPEQLMGLRPAPGYVQSPERREAVMKKVHRGQRKRKERFERRQKAQYGGTEE